MSWTKKTLNVLTVLISLFVALLIAEIFLRMFYPQNLSGTWDVMHPSGVMLNRTNGTVRHQFNDIVVSYSFGEYHNRKLSGATNTSGGDKVLVLGDSFTFGWLVADGFTYADRLQHSLSNKTFINAAVGGWGSADYAKYIELFCSKLKPTEIFIFLNTDDIGRAARSSLYKLNKDGTLINGEPPKQSRLKALLNKLPFYDWLLENSHLLSLARSVYLSALNPQQNKEKTQTAPIAVPTTYLANERDQAVAISLAKQIFLKIKKDSASCGSGLKVFYTGWVNLSDKTQDKNPTILFLREEKKSSFFKENQITFYDLAETKAMQDVYLDRSSYTIPADEHPNQLGAEKIFLAVMEKLGQK